MYKYTKSSQLTETNYMDQNLLKNQSGMLTACSKNKYIFNKFQFIYEFK